VSDADSTDFLPVFWATKRVLALASASAFARHGIHEGQQYILLCLWAEDGLTPGELARQLALSTPTVTRATTRMETAGLVRREPHEHDRRLVRLFLTPRGRALEKAIGREMDQLAQRALATLDQSARVALVGALNEIRRNLA
jgi:DNA-binding MarR family transcriptional regulator